MVINRLARRAKLLRQQELGPDYDTLNLPSATRAQPVRSKITTAARSLANAADAISSGGADNSTPRRIDDGLSGSEKLLRP